MKKLLITLSITLFASCFLSAQTSFNQFETQEVIATFFKIEKPYKKLHTSILVEYIDDNSLQIDGFKLLYRIHKMILMDGSQEKLCYTKNIINIMNLKNTYLKETKFLTKGYLPNSWVI